MVLNPQGRDPESYSGFRKNRKIGVIALVVLAIIIVIFWIWQVKSNIYHPFTFQGERPTELAQAGDGVCKGSNCLSDEELRIVDTDNDGLTDWEELNLYLTSPYLEDTDSDGLWDKVEVDSNSNPNCPEGQNCNGGIILEGDLDKVLENIKEEVVLPEGQEEDLLREVLGGDLNIQMLKELLIDSGLDEDIVGAFTDEQLLQIYNNTLENTEF